MDTPFMPANVRSVMLKASNILKPGVVYPLMKIRGQVDVAVSQMKVIRLSWILSKAS